MTNGIASILRWTSRLACLVALASFALFVLDQAGSASGEQQAEVNAAAPPGTAAASPPKRPSHGHGAVRKAIDEAAEAITSPFAGVTAGSSNQWVIRGGRTLLALILYGFGLGFLARVIRVRV
jgi:hypothetical protein